MRNSEDTGFELNLFEWGYLAEDTDPQAQTMKVYIPKIHGKMTGSDNVDNESVDNSAFANDSSSEVSASQNVEKPKFVVCDVALEFAHRHKWHDCPGTPCPNATHDAVVCHTGTSHLKKCLHYHHDHHFPHDEKTKLIPKGAKVIVLFMDKDLSQGIVTRMWCEFGGSKHPLVLPRERMS